MPALYALAQHLAFREVQAPHGPAAVLRCPSR